jgi:hypothetical protein
MKNCDQCGCEISPGAEVRDLVTEGGGRLGGGRKVVRTLCRECARRRANLAGFVLKVIALLLVGMILLGLLGRLLHH